MRIAFGTCSFIFQKSYPTKNNKGVYSHLEIEDMDREMEIPYVFPKKDNDRFNVINQKNFEKIPGSPLGYWVSERFTDVFKMKLVSDFLKSDGQILTGNNEKFIRFFWEVNSTDLIGDISWKLHHKGGDFRKWYGNVYWVVKWDKKTREFYRRDKTARIPKEEIWDMEGITWSTISSSKVSFRKVLKHESFNKAAPTLVSLDSKLIDSVIPLLNSKIIQYILNVYNPTLNYLVQDIENTPIHNKVFNNTNILKLYQSCFGFAKKDWDAHETSWDFQQNELIKLGNESIKTVIEAYKKEWSAKFYELHRNEEELNRQFIEIYGLQAELTPDVPLQEITILQEEAKIVNNQLEIQVVPVLVQLLSYSIGCMFGRYSLDKPGLILANQGETLQDYMEKIHGYGLQSPPLGDLGGFTPPSGVGGLFLPDSDNIIPVLDGEWFTDDIVGRFNEFLKVAFGLEHFEENLKYIEDTIGKDIRKYFVKDFYNDHIKRYKKRPIYWMFSSPKGHFKALIYMHRYQPDLCSRMLNEYLQTFIGKLESAKNTQTMFSLREDISGREKTLASKEIERLEDMLKDCRKYESTLFTIATQKIVIDLDDGVKVNYQKFKEVLVPIKGLEKEEE